MSLYNVVPTHIRFKLICLYPQARNSSRDHTLRRGKPKKTKIQKSKTILRGPKLLDFLVFLGFFGFSNRNPKNHMLFLILGGKPKKHRVFWFSCSVSGEKNPVLFGISVGKPKNTMCFFGFLLENKTNLGKPKNPTVSGPSEGFWIFRSLSLRANTARST